MKKLSITFLTLFAACMICLQAFAGDYEAMVVVKMRDLSLEQYNALAAMAQKDSKIEVEYYCLWSGVVVIKLDDISWSNPADLEMFPVNKLKAGTGNINVKVLDTHLREIGGSSKC